MMTSHGRKTKGDSVVRVSAHESRQVDLMFKIIAWLLIFIGAATAIILVQSALAVVGG